MANERLPERSIFIAMNECEGIPTDAEMTNSVAGTIHPGSESGHAFVPIVRAGWCRHTKV